MDFGSVGSYWLCRLTCILIEQRPLELLTRGILFHPESSSLFVNESISQARYCLWKTLNPGHPKQRRPLKLIIEIFRGEGKRGMHGVPLLQTFSHAVHTKLKFTLAHVLCQRSSCRLYFGITDKTLRPRGVKNGVSE